MRAKQVYWLVSPKSPIHDQIFNALRTRQVTVIQVLTFQDLCDRFNQKRAGIVLIGDELGQDILIDQLPKIVIKPEFNGVRFLLSINQPRPKLCRLAIALGFRDILSRDLPIPQWIKRFEFACANGEVAWQEPIPKMTTHSISAINIPARITWMDSHQLRFESKIIIPKGGTARLTGKISEELGLSSISVRILNHIRTGLKFRFSESYQCEWETPKNFALKRNLLLDSLKTPMDQAPYKIFIAVLSYDLRQLLMQTLNDHSFDLTIALQKSGLMHETKFIDPDVVIIEHRLIDSKAEVYLAKMVENIRGSVPIYIVGANKSEQIRYERLTGRNDKSIIAVQALPSNFANYLKRKLERLMRSEVTEAGYYIPSNHRFSLAEIRLPARLIQIHPESVRMVVPYELGRFGFCMIDAPIFKQNLQRQVVGKITNSYHHYNSDLESFPYAIELVISDLIADERQRIANDLVRHFSEQMIGQRLDFRHLQLTSKKEDTRTEHIELPTITMKPTAKEAPPPAARRLTKTKSLPEIRIRDGNSGVRHKRKKSFWEEHAKEVQVTGFTLFLFLILFALIYAFRQPESEQGKAYSESFRKIYEYYNPEKRGQ